MFKKAIFLVLFLLYSVVCVGYSDLSFDHFPKETQQLACKVSKLKEKYKLEYEDSNDLLETCYYITEYSKYSKFDKYDVASIVIKEAKFKRTAFNKNDGGKGLGQLTGINTWHKDTLFWMTDPYDKEQNIRGIYILLAENMNMYKHKQIALKRYNGKTYKSEKYRKEVNRIKDVLKATKA